MKADVESNDVVMTGHPTCCAGVADWPYFDGVANDVVFADMALFRPRCRVWTGVNF